MFCAISGTIPEEPVVSRKSGLLFEKRLIEKSLTASGGKCPETGEELGPEDLIEVKTSGKVVQPLKSSSSSFPGLLTHLQSEWDAIVLENQQVKKVLSKTRQELAHALYRFDASTRVIARLTSEKEELQQALDNAFEKGEKPVASKRKLGERTDGANGDSVSTDVNINGDDVNALPEAKRRKETLQGEAMVSEKRSDGAGVENGGEKSNSNAPKEPSHLTQNILDEVGDLNKKLLSNRKTRKTPSSLAQASEFDSYVSVASCSELGGLPVTSVVFLDDERIAVGSVEGKISILHASTLSSEESREASSTSINALCTPPSDNSVFVSGSDDGCVRVWDSKSNGGEKFVLNCSSGVVDVAFHPNGSLLFSCSDDGTWNWIDVVEQKTLSSLGSGLASERYCSGAVHPDGLLFANGCANGSVELWDIREMKKLATFADERFVGNVGVSALNMSENGYYMAAAVNGTVALWDLRRHKVAREFKIEESAQPVAVKIDYSGTYGCAVSKHKHLIFSTKKKGGVLAKFQYDLGDSGDAVPWKRPGVAWAGDAKALVTGRMDGIVDRYGTAT